MNFFFLTGCQMLTTVFTLNSVNWIIIIVRKHISKSGNISKSKLISEVIILINGVDWWWWFMNNRWYGERGLGELGLSQEDLLQAYYLAAASIFEPERSQERLAWVKTTALMETIKSIFIGSDEFSRDHKTAFLREIVHGRCPDYEDGEERYIYIISPEISEVWGSSSWDNKRAIIIWVCMQAQTNTSALGFTWNYKSVHTGRISGGWQRYSSKSTSCSEFFINYFLNDWIC